VYSHVLLSVFTYCMRKNKYPDTPDKRNNLVFMALEILTQRSWIWCCNDLS